MWDLVNVSIEEKSLYHKNNLGIITEISDNINLPEIYYLVKKKM